MWQERLVKNGKKSILQGFVVIVLALPLIILTGIFPVGGSMDSRYDKRVATGFIENTAGDRHVQNQPQKAHCLSH